MAPVGATVECFSKPIAALLQQTRDDAGLVQDRFEALHLTSKSCRHLACRPPTAGLNHRLPKVSVAS